MKNEAIELVKESVPSKLKALKKIKDPHIKSKLDQIISSEKYQTSARKLIKSSRKSLHDFTRELGFLQAYMIFALEDEIKNER